MKPKIEVFQQNLVDVRVGRSYSKEAINHWHDMGNSEEFILNLIRNDLRGDIGSEVLRNTNLIKKENVVTDTQSFFVEFKMTTPEKIELDIQTNKTRLVDIINKLIRIRDDKNIIDALNIIEEIKRDEIKVY